MNKRSLFIFSFRENIKFLISVLFFIILVISFFLHIMPQYTGTYQASLIDKVERLRSIKESKIVLIGNSNLSFGINSQKIEDAFDMPVVNMGLHGGLGNAFHEEMARLNVQGGDIYVLCHTSYADDDTITDRELAWITIENHVELWRILREQDIMPMLRAFPSYFKKCFRLYSERSGNQIVEGCYSRAAFNEYGDIVTERKQSEYTFASEVNPPPIGDITVERINALSDYLEDKGASLVVAGYPIGKGELTAKEEDFEVFQNELERRLKCPVISDYKDYYFDYDLFYNTDLHLTDEGVERRTEQLIEDLTYWLGKRFIN